MEDNRSLEERVNYLENRVRELEKQLGLGIQHSPINKENKESGWVEPVPIKEKESIAWDVLIFQKTLPRLFIFVFIIGILWGFKAASDYGFITDSVKVILGFLVAVTMVSIGISQMNKNRKVLGQVLLGGAIPTFMLTTFSMHQLYGITGPEISFILNIIWIGLGIFFTYQYKSQGIGIISSIGGVFVPFLIESATPNILVFIFYETILYTLFIWIALKRRYQSLYYVSAVFLNISLLFFFFFTQIPDEHKWIVVSPIIVQQFALLFGFFKTNYMLKQQAYTLFSSVILIYLWLETVFTTDGPAIVFGLIAILYGACFYVFKTDRIRAPIFIANSLMGILYFSLTLIDNLTFEVLIGSSIIYMFVSKTYKSLFHAFLAGIFYVISFSILFEKTVVTWISWEMLHWVVFIVATGYGIYYLARSKERKTVMNYGIPYFALLILMYMRMISNLLVTDAGSDSERMVTSILWIATAILFMVASKPLSINQGKYVGAGILFITLGKIILFDIYFVSVGVRALLFIILGAVGLVVSRAYYKK